MRTGDFETLSVMDKLCRSEEAVGPCIDVRGPVYASGLKAAALVRVPFWIDGTAVKLCVEFHYINGAELVFLKCYRISIIAERVPFGIGGIFVHQVFHPVAGLLVDSENPVADELVFHGYIFLGEMKNAFITLTVKMITKRSRTTMKYAVSEGLYPSPGRLSPVKTIRSKRLALESARAVESALAAFFSACSFFSFSSFSSFSAYFWRVALSAASA